MAPVTRVLQTPRQIAGGSAACVVGFLGVLALAYGSEPAARLDAVALEEFGAPLGRPLLARAAAEVARLADPVPFALLAACLCAAALFLRGGRQAVGLAVLLAGSNVTTQLLKPALDEPRGTLGGWLIGAEAFPSGHATASMSLALAAVLVAPRRWRPLVAAGGALFAISVGFAIVALDWHFPSDVAGGYLMAGAWCFAVTAALALAERRRPWQADHAASPRPASHLAWAVLLAAVTVAAVLGASRFPELLGYARGHKVFAVVAGATATLAVALVAAAGLAAGAIDRGGRRA